MKLMYRSSIPAVVAVVKYVICTAFAVTALPTSHQSLLAQTVQFVPPPPPADRGETSGRRQGGASRGDCPPADQPLTALVPAKWNSKQKSSSGDATIDRWESVWGKTVSDTPTFWFYLPYSTPNLPLLFILQDNQGKNIYQISLNTSQSGSGIVQVSLPTTSKSPALEVNKLYHWYFVVDCNQDVPTQVDGWIQRVAIAPSLSRQIKMASPLQQVALYASNGIWYDALNILAQTKKNNPQDPKLLGQWTSLLNSVGLESIASKPVKNCCTPQKSTGAY